MDETRTREKLDDLAELFLTGAVDHAEPKNQGGTDRSDLLDGPAPIRLAPKPATKPSSSTQPPEVEAGATDESLEDAELERALRDAAQSSEDDKPKLRLAADDDDQQVSESSGKDKGDQSPARAAVEAIVMGNLPGLGGAWLTQYAQLIAQSDGPVAVLHVADDAIDVELIEPRAEALPAPTRSTATLRIPPMRGGKTGLLGLLDALVRTVQQPVQTILVRLEPTTDPRDLSRLAAIDDWTLLCGSDDASVAGGRQMLQQLTQADPRLAGKHVGVMIMGSDEDKSETAATRLKEASEDLLRQPVQFIGHLQRMQPVQVRQLGTFADPVSLWPQLVNWFDALELPEESEPVPSTKPDVEQAADGGDMPEMQRPSEPEAQTQAGGAAAKPTADPASVGSSPAPRPGPFHVPNPPPPAAIRRMSQSSAKAAAQKTASKPTQPQQPEPAKPAAEAKPEPAPAAKTSPKAATAPNPGGKPRNLRPAPRLDLASLLADTPAAIDDPATLDARIPHQPAAQMVVDGQGTIHVLVRHDSTASDDTAASSPQQAILDLIDARRWVNEHLELLALTQRDREFATAEPTLHLLTDRADLAMGLVARLGDSLKLHLLQEVKLGRETGWFCTPLN